MAKGKTSSRSKDNSAAPIPMYVLMPLCVLMIVLLKASFVLLLVMMLPSIVAFYADTSEDRMEVTTITCNNFAGCLPYVVELSVNNGEWPMLSFFLSNPTVWLASYGMAALGYLLIRVCPHAYHYALLALHTSIVMNIEHKQEALVNEWGEAIKHQGE